MGVGREGEGKGGARWQRLGLAESGRDARCWYFH